MKSSRIFGLILAALLVSLSGVSHAQQVGLTREQVSMDRDTFLKMFRWSEASSEWVLKSGMAPPKGVMSRDEVIAMRDKFLSTSRWDELSSQFVPIKGEPRKMSGLTREQVERETAMFIMTHRFDETSSQWVSKTRPQN